MAAPPPAPPEPAPTFAAWLRARRQALGLTQAALAARTGCSLVAVRKFEAGTRRPAPALAGHLAEALELPAAAHSAFAAWARAAADPTDLLAVLRATPRLPRTPLPLAPLPLAATTFLGREAELAAIQVWGYATAGAQLLTLTGTGGVGKTRLALQAATGLGPAFADGVAFVPLAALRDPTLMLGALAHAVGVPETPGQSLLTSLQAALADRHLLLVLDNCEHLPAIGPLLGALLAACPRLHVLATSRAPLGLPDEQIQVVPTLPVPAPQHQFSLAEVAQSAAVALFVDRARVAQPTFAVIAANAPIVAAICARLDGLPLALELAAARIRLLPPAALLARLAAAPGYGPLELLAGGSERPARHQTLRTTIAWSYELLDPTEQALFRRMAVFRGGARLAAIVAVARELLPAATGELGLDGSAAAEAETGGAAPPDGIEVAARLASLVDKSLLRQVAAEGEAPRYMLLETIREFAWEQLAAAGGEQATGQAHARVYLILAEAAVPHFDTAQESAWLDRLAAEQDNLRAALDWARASDPSIGLRLAAAIWPFWRSRGHLREGYSYLTEFLTRAPALTAWRAKALQGAGALAYFLGDQEAAEAWHTQSLDCYHALGDIAGEAGALADVAIYAYERGAYPAAQARYEASLRLYQQIAPGAGRAFVLMMLGNTILQTGDAARARHLLAESLDLYRAVGANRGILMALTAQGEMARQLGADRAARTCYAQCVALCRATQNTHYLPLSLHNLGQALLRLGDDAQAAATFTEGLRRAGEVGNQRAAALCVAGLGGVAVVRGQALHAAHLLAAAPTLLTAHGQQLEPMDATVYAQFVARSREQLDPATWQAAWTAGQTLTLAQAMEYALQPRPPGPAAEPVSPSDTRPGHPLTPREREVLRYLTTGLTNRQIAAVLGMSVNAVERHLGTIYSKFDLHSRSAVTRYAIDHGLI